MITWHRSKLRIDFLCTIDPCHFYHIPWDAPPQLVRYHLPISTNPRSSIFQREGNERGEVLVKLQSCNHRTETPRGLIPAKHGCDAMRMPMERMERWESPLGSELTLLWSASCQLDCCAWLLLCWKCIAISLDGSDGHWIRPNWDSQNKQDKQTQCKLCQCKANVRAYYQNRYVNCLKLGPIPATRRFGNTSCISEAKLMFPVSTGLDDLHLEVLEVEQLPKKVQSSALKSPHSRWMQMRENAIFTCSLCRA